MSEASDAFLDRHERTDSAVLGKNAPWRGRTPAAAINVVLYDRVAKERRT